MTHFDFTGKVAVVTGAGGGIGRAAVLALAVAGAKVMAVDLNREQGEETARLAEQMNGEVRFLNADVSQSEDVKRYVSETLVFFGGRVDIFLNNAGWQGAVAPLTEYSDDIFDQVMGVNVRGTYLGLKHVLPVMQRQRSGAIVNTASIAAYIGTRNLAPYTASKHAVLGLTKAAALEVARQGIRINAVCPGPVDTEMLRDIEANQAPADVEALRRKRTSGIPDGRYALPEEVANLMLYLVSDLSTHITGQGLLINGGAF
jgi:NAD(P)-dependent dehydrogenase (short-subunit alcohol dehydrogenase family)